MSLINRTFLFVILLISCTVLAISQKCYDSNGVETGNTPCNASALVSHCCGPTFVCLDNGLCKPGPNSSDAGYQTFTAFYHAGCTDPTFKSEECSKFCMSEDDNPDGQGLNSCAGDEVGLYCCWRPDSNCCDNKTAILTLGVANVQTTIGYVPSSSTTASTSTTTTTAESSTIQTSTSTASPTTTAPAAAKHSSNAVNVGVGVGVGVGFSLMLAIAIAIVLYRRKLRVSRKTNILEGYGFVPKAEMDASGQKRPSKMIPPQELEARDTYRVHELR